MDVNAPCGVNPGDCDDLMAGDMTFSQVTAANTHHFYGMYGDNPVCGAEADANNAADRLTILNNAGVTAGGDIIGVVCYDDQNLVQALRAWGYNL